MEKRKKKGSIAPYILIAILGVVLVLWFNRDSVFITQWSYNELYLNLGEGNIYAAEISQNNQIPTGTVTFYLNDGEKAELHVQDVSEVIKLLLDNEVVVRVNDVPGNTSFILSIVLPILIGMFLIAFLVMSIMNKAMSGGSNGKMMNFGKSRARLVTEVRNIDFTKVA